MQLDPKECPANNRVCAITHTPKAPYLSVEACERKFYPRSCKRQAILHETAALLRRHNCQVNRQWSRREITVRRPPPLLKRFLVSARKKPWEVTVSPGSWLNLPRKRPNMNNFVFFASHTFPLRTIPNFQNGGYFFLSFCFLITSFPVKLFNFRYVC